MDVPHRRILLIDDEYVDHKIISILMSKRGISVDECLTATAAIPMVNKNGYDAILIDYRLNGITGVELIKKLQCQIKCPIYIISAFEKEYIQEHLDKSGVTVDGIIPKVNLKQNLRTLEEVLFGE